MNNISHLTQLSSSEEIEKVGFIEISGIYEAGDDVNPYRYDLNDYTVALPLEEARDFARSNVDIDPAFGLGVQGGTTCKVTLLAYDGLGDFKTISEMEIQPAQISWIFKNGTAGQSTKLLTHFYGLRSELEQATDSLQSAYESGQKETDAALKRISELQADTRVFAKQHGVVGRLVPNWTRSPAELAQATQEQNFVSESSQS